jgi:hypothetical protein
MNCTKKIRKIKRLVFFFVFISLFLGTQVAWGSQGGNEVKNGDFQTGDLSYWTSSGNQIVVRDLYSPGDYYAWLGGNQTGFIYQVIDENQYSGWNPLGTAKHWIFTINHDQFQAGSFVRFRLYYYPSNPTGQPAFDPNNPANWAIFLDHTFHVDEYGLYKTQGTINNFQPRWVAVSIQMSTSFEGQAVVDNVYFANRVLLPGVVLLLLLN